VLLGAGAYPAVSPDGRQMLFQRINPETQGDLYRAPLDGSEEPTAFLVEGGHATRSAFSPDGRYVAFVVERGGRPGLFLRPYPEGEGVWQVSTEGGDHPRFSRAGDRLFYTRGSEVMEVTLTLGPTPQLGTPRLVVSGETDKLHLDSGYDVAPDGSGFVAVREVPDQRTAVPNLTLVQSWFAEFRSQAGVPES